MMIVLLLCVIMKIAEFSVGRASPQLAGTARPTPPFCTKRKRQERNYYNRKSAEKCICMMQKRAGKGAAVMEDPQTPGSDCNSNPAIDSIQQDLISSEFVQDNVDYQWFIDYGYRDGGLHVHPSVLSSLSASYSREDLGYYDDLARNLDANLAEIDMESFRTADIHTLLTALPVMCTDPIQHSEGEDSACSTMDTISICKSSLLFSPLKETPMLPPGGSYSVDSLDCEDMLLTCQANNKNNYTIAFEGSITMYSDGSQDFENQEKQKTCETAERRYSKKADLKNALDLSMACSDSKIYTTWSNLKHTSMNRVITRHPSGNNNTIPNFLQSGNVILSGNKRSQSLPDLNKARELHNNVPLNFSVDSVESNNQAQQLQSSGSVMSRSINEDSSDSGENNPTGKKLQNLSLVRLFMKQKSMSTEGMSLTLDQSDSVSDNGWPTSNSDSGTNTNTNTNTNTQIQRQNINNTCNRPISNDFSINWVQNNCNNQETEQHRRESFVDIPRHTSPIKEDNDVGMVSSASVEELSESISKSDLTHDDSRHGDSDIEQRLERRFRNTWCTSLEKQHPVSKTTGVQAIVETEDNEAQTSLIYPVPQEKENPSLRETVVNKKPVYVVYPNYTLPDLSFLNITDAKPSNVNLKPQCFNKNKIGWRQANKSNRPFSCNDIDALKQRGFSHIKDWESLTFLLPAEYKKILHDVPEVSKHINMNEETRKPLFCLSPPMRHKTRLIGDIIPNNTSSTSSTATQPSSGYRGSSTILTDSSTNQQATSTTNTPNPLYLYRYDSISSDASLVSNDKKIHRPINQGVRGISVLPKRSVSLPHGDKEIDSCNGRVPPRPPLPRSILRKNRAAANKRYSMFEMGGVEEVDDHQSPETNKRMSLQEPYYMNNDLQLLYRGKIVDSEKDVDETEERYHTAERLNEIATNTEVDTDSQHSEDDVKQLEEFLKRSGFSSQSSDGDNTDDPDVKLRSYVRKFLALRMNKDIARNGDMGESQKKTVSFAVHQRKKHLDNKASNLNVSPSDQIKDRLIPEEGNDTASENKSLDLEEKKRMISSVNKAVDSLLKYWNTESVHDRQNYSDKNECAQICISTLCPALYAIMSDGLKSHLNSTFGPITNSVWQVVEASSQHPLTKTLNELVQKINGEDVITEGMLKFHAFVFGLLNLRALDAWFAYLCTRESILRKHYNSNSLFIGALANTNAREIVDALLYILNPLAFCPFRLDLLYQYRQLHNSFGNMNNHAVNAVNFKNVDLNAKEYNFDETELTSAVSSPRRVRPRSCVAYYNHDEKLNNSRKTDLENVKKRLSNPICGKVFHALDKLTSEDSEDYTDSLEHSPLNRAAKKQSTTAKLTSPETKTEDEDTITGVAKFKKLQEKWEHMVGKEETKTPSTVSSPLSPTRTPGSIGKSKIPRLLTSPVKQSNLTLGTTKTLKSPSSGIPTLKKPVVPSMMKTATKKPVERSRDTTRRTSRVDQDNTGTPRSHLARPSSLPYKSHGVSSKEINVTSPHRRAASTSLPRATVTQLASKKTPSKQLIKLIH